MLTSKFFNLAASYLKANEFLFKNVYKSAYNLDNLYPNSQSVDYKKLIQEKVNSSKNKFSGYIPIDELQISYTKSSGPGGQNVNKVNTKVEIRFHVPSAKWIPETLKENLKIKEAGRITKDGFLVVSSDKTRKQLLNQADCFDKIRTIIWACQENTYTPSQQVIEEIKSRQEKAKHGILREKREHSLKKQSRSSPGIHDV